MGTEVHVQASKTRLLDHLRWLRQAASESETDLLVAGHSLQALLRRDGQRWALEPRFLSASSELVFETPALDDYVQGFAGWLPHPPRTWDTAEDAIRFNSFVREHGLPAPELVFEEAPGLADVMIRSAMRDLRATCRGPYRMAIECPLEPARREYYEPYRSGPQLRLWFWNDLLVCGEIVAAPTVTGNGASTVRDLIADRAAYSRPWAENDLAVLLARCAPLVAYHGSGLGTVPGKGERVVVDHGMDSPLAHPSDRQALELTGAPDTGWVKIARRAGAEIMSAAPEEWRSGTLYTVDAVLHSDEQLWLMAMDANPTVHPVVYPAMVHWLVAGASPRDGQVATPPGKEGTA